MRAIATELGRSPSTISRELRRNVPPLTTQYRPYRADQLAKARQTRPKTPKILLTPQLLEKVSQKLAQHWSPEQISAWLHREFADNENMHLCPETIYQAIYVQAKGQLKLEVKTALRTGRVRRKSHALDQQRIGRFREPMTMISDRPAGVEEFREELFGYIMPMIEQGCFQSLSQGEGWWSAAWLALGDVAGEGCE